MKIGKEEADTGGEDRPERKGAGVASRLRISTKTELRPQREDMKVSAKITDLLRLHHCLDIQLENIQT